MSRLQILITQYRENEDIIKNILNSIEDQKNIDLKNDIEVFIGNDGSDIKLSKNFLEQYSFPIQYHFFKHSGLAGCRKHLYDLSTSEYIMFCDGDDMFSNNVALSLIFQEIDKSFDCLNCDYYQEKMDKDNKLRYKLNSNDNCHIHGLILNRKFLNKNKIEWHPELYEYQDFPYVMLVKILAKNPKCLNIPLYIWKYYSDSISNRDGKNHIVFTTSHFIDAYDCLISDLLQRGFGFHARYYTISCLYDIYYNMQHPIWNEEQNTDYKINVYKRISKLYKKYSLLILYYDGKNIDKIIENGKKIIKNEKSLIVLPPIEEWLQSILNLFTNGD